MPEIVCTICQKTDSEARLVRCPICYKYVCDEHEYNYSGRVFCGKHCAEYFFFADADD